ncbi:MAG: ATP synthase F1 subunit epsilon [Flammeovirgaceae bacterium]|nr:ATP synthase F1 subunit epsilon [Flammeovirgaceae bacterium]
MFVEIITPDKKAFEGEALGVRVPGSSGSFEMLNKHAPIISSLSKGEVRVRTKEGDKTFLIDGGMVEMRDNKIIVLAESILS